MKYDKEIKRRDIVDKNTAKKLTYEEACELYFKYRATVKSCTGNKYSLESDSPIILLTSPEEIKGWWELVYVGITFE